MVACVGRSRWTSRWGAVLRGVDYRETPISRARALSHPRDYRSGAGFGTADEDFYNTLITIYNILRLGCVRRISRLDRTGCLFFHFFSPYFVFFPFCFRSRGALFPRISRIARWRMSECVCVRVYTVCLRVSLFLRIFIFIFLLYLEVFFFFVLYLYAALWLHSVFVYIYMFIIFVEAHV